MEAGTATGWQATDWLEDIMLRTAGIDAYNNWITHDLKFNSPEVTTAMDDAGKIFFTDGYVFGGPQGAIATHQTDPMDPMFPPDGNWDGFTPGCWMQKQATWYGPDFFPDVKATTPAPRRSIRSVQDIGLFYFPPIDPAQGTPALGAGDTLMVMQPPDGSAADGRDQGRRRVPFHPAGHAALDRGRQRHLGQPDDPAGVVCGLLQAVRRGPASWPTPRASASTLRT